MNTEDKYGIAEAIERHFESQGVLEVSDRLYVMKCIAAIWEDVYVRMPLKDTDDKDMNSLLKAIKVITGESMLKVEQSCGLFYQTKLILAHGTWYLERSSCGYCILPEYRAGRRFPTRLNANVAADLILTFDSHIPKIHSQADAELRRRKEAMLTTEIIATTVTGIVHSMVNEGRIKVPGNPYVRGMNPQKIHIYFDGSPDIMTSSLEKVEERLLKKYGKEK